MTYATSPWPRWYRPPGYASVFPRDLVRDVANYFGITPDDIVGDCREKHLIDARATVVSLLRKRGLSYPLIGRFIGGRDHTTIINLSRNLVNYRRRNPLIVSAEVRFGL